MIRIMLFFGLCIGGCMVAAQSTKHLVYFTDKANTPYSITAPSAFLSQKSIDRRNRQGISIKQRDLPVDPVYVDSLKALGADVWYTSRWFNAAFIEADSTLISGIDTLGFIANTQVLERPSANASQEMKEMDPIPNMTVTAKNNTATLDFYGQSRIQVEMLGADVMHNLGYTGSGMTIAVHDNGFSNADILSAFQNLHARSGILGTYDFVQHNANVYDNGSHGTMVLSTMAAYMENEIIGIAYDADYYLFVTENTAGENPDEEVYWLIAAERSDSLGVDIINTSLGYSTFDNPALDHVYADLNGRTTIISKASEIAANTGMLIVTSAGNAGASAWRYITAPGDADSIITAGAVDSLLAKTGFSSVGPTADGRIKPDLCALGQDAAIVDPSGSVLLGNGTSFASPILASLAAGFWQAHPHLSAQEVIGFLKASATQSLSPDTLQGWGVPNFSIAHGQASGIQDVVRNKAKLRIYPNPTSGNQLTVFFNGTSQRNHILTISNSMGQKVMEMPHIPVNQPIQVPLTQMLTPGIYVLSVKNDVDFMSHYFVVN